VPFIVSCATAADVCHAAQRTVRDVTSAVERGLSAWRATNRDIGRPPEYRRKGGTVVSGRLNVNKAPCAQLAIVSPCMRALRRSVRPALSTALPADATASAVSGATTAMIRSPWKAS
jgi:hypothetical protein